MFSLLLKELIFEFYLYLVMYNMYQKDVYISNFIQLKFSNLQFVLLCINGSKSMVIPVNNSYS